MPNTEERIALISACKAAMKYDSLIRQVVKNGKVERTPDGGIVKGDELDEAYMDWMKKSHDALLICGEDPHNA